MHSSEHYGTNGGVTTSASILALVEEGPITITNRELAAQLGRSERAVAYAMRHLRTSGQLAVSYDHNRIRSLSRPAPVG